MTTPDLPSLTGNLLLITNEDQHASSLCTALNTTVQGNFNVETVTHLGAAVTRLEAGEIDVILTDLNLPDSQGIETFDQLFAAAPTIPILICSEPGNELMEIAAVERGAYGYLPKGRLGNSLIERSLCNIIQQKIAEEILFIEKSRAQITLNSISDAVITTDLQGRVDYLNQAAEAMTGWTLTEADGRPISEIMTLISGSTRKPERNPAELVLQCNEPMGLMAGTVLVRRDGTEVAVEDSAAPIHDSSARLCGAVITFHDISASKAMTKKMAYLAYHDSLTDLPNRVLLNDRISQAIEISSRRKTSLAVLFLDLDSFKDINDNMGHIVGDLLLRSVAHRLTSSVRGSDTVSRVGGDEFIILLLGDSLTESLALIVGKILKKLAEPHVVGSQTLSITASIGISTYPTDGLDTETLVKKADSAMYLAKNSGRNTYCFCRDEGSASKAGA